MTPLHLLVLPVIIMNHASCESVYKQRFLEQYNKMHDPNNGYFSSKGIPYHAVETLVVESSDYGHETTSEAHSYYIWLEAMYGGITNNFSRFNEAWEIMEKYIIPVHESQPNTNLYNPSHPAGYGPEQEYPEDYPVGPVDPPAPVGIDPLYQELVDTYGTSDIYAMHWLTDVDNVYGFGNSPGNCELGPNEPGPSFINTYQRGPRENAWKTIPQPTCDSHKYGGPEGFGPLFSTGDHAPNWKYSVAPDADARAIAAAFWASRWATKSGHLSEITDTLQKAGKLGDYLRYCFFDQNFKRIGNCIDPYKCPGGTGKDSAHYLLGWYFGWGGSISSEYGYSWRIGDGVAHFGYQNPMAAYALINEPNMTPKGATAVKDWQISLDRQLELYDYLQSVEGAFAGGVSNSWNGRYEQPPEELMDNTFHGMFYNWEPVAYDPPSNQWFGMQPWSTDRLAQYYYITGDDKAKKNLDKWVSWIIANTYFEGDDYRIPSTLDWVGVPPNVHCKVVYYGNGVGPAAATARTLSYYAARANHAEAKNLAKKILDSLWNLHRTPLGIAVEEQPEIHFNQSVYVPKDFHGVYPNGDVIDSDSTFISMRSFYKNDPQWNKIESYMNGGPAPKFTYHRFWDQTDVALGFGVYGLLFDE
ncbi:exoglucanase B-like [Diabrotica virgifera virgifera]|uniref:Glycoside hydrolase family protein 48 n=1 Tax=Diabrotica virgifera virgifera TaxID=50390 RepID=A0ABM5K2Y5_DIAVI|nr:exoglucanase B-like [Diabrotica virgifera virgifera]